MRKFTYSRTLHSIEGTETFTAEAFDSFDEAQRAVEHGIRDRKIQLAEKYSGSGIGGGTALSSTPAMPTGVRPSQNPSDNEGNGTSDGNPPAHVPSTTGGQ